MPNDLYTALSAILSSGARFALPSELVQQAEEALVSTDNNMPVSHRGKHTHRLAQNALEQEFSDAWVKANDVRHQTLAMLMGTDNRPAATSAQDELVAATAVQWLGSPVGQGLLRSVLATDAGKEFLKTL